MLRVGPRSAGADPGPACYGRGGRHPTVTDANVVLGRIPETVALAGSFPVDRDAALSVIAPLAAAAGMTSDEMALGIVRVANENMASALRMISVQRGYDPAEFTLASFGGAGGLHVCALAEAMGMDRAIVPVDAGVLSALGMLVAPRGRQYSRTVRVPVRDAGRDALEATLEELAERGTHDLMAEGLPRASLRMERSADLCYLGQSSTLNLPWENDSSAMVAAFHGLHLERYGFELDRAIEVVNLRVRLVSDHATPQLTEAVRVTAGNKSRGDVVYDVASRFPVFARSGLRKGETVQGPAIVTEQSATTFIDHDWSGALDRIGNLTLVRTRKAPAR
jgi:N-methylhydantoinase A